jgi:hypothetical protein
MWKRKNKKSSTRDTKEFDVAVDPEIPAAATEMTDASSSPADDAVAADAAATAQRRATVRQVDLILGQIVSVLMRSPQHKHYSLETLHGVFKFSDAAAELLIVKADLRATAAANQGRLVAKISERL